MMEEQTGRLRLRALNHISRVCGDVAKSCAFYRDILGFYEVKRPQALAFEGAWLFNYGIGIHLIKGCPEGRNTDIVPKDDHLSFQAEGGLEEVEGQLAAMGLPFKKQTIMENGVRVTQLFMHDPDHNMIEICNCELLPVVPISSDATFCPSCLTNGPMPMPMPHSPTAVRPLPSSSPTNSTNSTTSLGYMSDKSSEDRMSDQMSDHEFREMVGSGVQFKQPLLRRSCSTSILRGQPHMALAV